MKKLLGILVLGLLLCSNAFAYCADAENCPKPPKYSESSVVENIFKYEWNPGFSHEVLRHIVQKFNLDINVDLKYPTNMNKLDLASKKKIFSKLTDEYFILNSLEVGFSKIDPNSGFSGEWRLRCVAEYKIDCRITGPMF